MDAMLRVIRTFLHQIDTHNQNNSHANTTSQLNYITKNGIMTKCHHDNTPHNITSHEKNAITKKIPSQKNSITTKGLIRFFSLYSTPPSILQHMTWVLQNRLTCSHHKRVGSADTILPHHSFACRWGL